MDINTLASIIQGDPRYDTAVQDGNNGILRDLLNEIDVQEPMRWRGCSITDFLDAVSAETLTTDELTYIQSYAAGGQLPLFRAAGQAWVEAKFSSNGGAWSAATEAAVRVLVEKESPYCVDALARSEDAVSLRDVRKAVRQVPDWWGSSASTAARVADKQVRKDREAARKVSIEAAMIVEGFSGIRPEVRQMHVSAYRRHKAEVLMRMREGRYADGLI